MSFANNHYNDRPSFVAADAARWRVPFSVGHLGRALAVVDGVLIVLCGLGAAFLYHGYIRGGGVDVFRYATIGIMCFLNFAFLMAARGAYQVSNVTALNLQVRSLTFSWIVVITVFLGLAFGLKIADQLSRGATIIFFVSAWLSLLLSRWVVASPLFHTVAFKSLAPQPVVLIADREELMATNIIDDLRERGYECLRTFPFQANASKAALRKVVDNALSASRIHSVKGILLLSSWRDPRTIEEIATGLRGAPLPVHLVPDHKTARLLVKRAVQVDGLSFAELQRAPLSATERTVKRAFDIVAASVGLIVLSPLLAMVAVMVKLDSNGPVFFFQTRHGFNRRDFRIVKFRSMTVTEDGPTIRQATRGDPRVTRLGEWMRKTSVDELPQLWNVLVGHMSIVGPRPHAAAHTDEFERLIALYSFRHHVKPGLTGWAQVNGFRGETATVAAMERRVEHDIYYVNHWSLWFDIKIIARTVGLVVRDPAAY